MPDGAPFAEGLAGRRLRWNRTLGVGAIQGYRVGVDVGGTFTDVVLPAADGSLHALKLLSSPHDYGRAIVAGAKDLLESAGVDTAAVDELVHGTTVATNSTDVVPEIGEYERTSTTVINACLLPLVRSYLGSLRTKLADIGVTGRLLVMQSHGGIAGDRAAAMRPAYIVESGPACYALGGTEPTVTDANVVRC